MANYTPSDLVAAQAKLFGAFAAQEKRFRAPVTHLEFLRQAEIMIPSYASLRTDESRSVNAYYKDRTSRALGSARAHDHSGVKGDSTVFTPTWATKSDKFAISLKQGGHNVYDRQEMLVNEFENAFINFVEELDGDAEDHIFANRSTATAATQQMSFDATDDVHKITESSEGTRAVQITQSVMNANKFGGKMTLFCDSQSHDIFMQQRFQGAGNSENLTFNFNSNVDIVHSLGMDAHAASLAGTYKGFWIAVVDGTIAALPWIPKENRMGVVNEGINIYGSMINPIDGLTLATHSYEARADESGTGGQLQDVRTEFELSVDLALDNAPFTAGTATSTILAFGLV